jgi:WD40 repeat protein
LAVSADGRLIASSSLDDTVRIWEMETGEELYRLAGHGSSGGHRAVTFTEDGQRLVSWGDDMYLRIWDVSNGRALHEHALRPSGVDIPDEDLDVPQVLGPEDWRMRLERADLSPDGRYFFLGYGGTLYVFDTETGDELHKWERERERVASIAASPEGRWILTGAWSAHPIRLMDRSSGEVLWSFDLEEAGTGPVAFSKDGARMAAAFRRPENQLVIWEAPSGREVSRIEDLPGVAFQRGLAFSPDGGRIACALSDATVLIWNLQETPHPSDDD